MINIKYYYKRYKFENMEYYIYVSINKYNNKLFEKFYSLSDLSNGIKIYNELDLNLFKYYQIKSFIKFADNLYLDKYLQYMINTNQIKEIN